MRSSRAMLGESLKRIADTPLRGAVARAASMGVRPEFALVSQVLCGAVSGVAFALRSSTVGLAFFLLHGLFDYLDGALRRTGRASTWLDGRAAENAHAASDKASELFLFAGLAAGGWSPWWLAALAALASVGATLAGIWLRDRRKISRRQALFDRSDRMLLLLVSLVTGAPSLGLAATVALSAVVLLQRSRQARHSH